MLLECVANISEGRNIAIIRALSTAISTHCSLLHTDTSCSAHRTVFTFAGEPKMVIEAAFALCKSATDLIDMRLHVGAHPRLGAVDVLPFIPLRGITEKEANMLTHELAERLGRELHLPIYLYEQSASKEYRAALPQVRKGEYEGLSKKMLEEKWLPDFYFHNKGSETVRKSGAIIMGVRRMLVAYNISLATADPSIAEKIAQRIRSSGFKDKVHGKKIKGIFPALRAIGWYLEEFGSAQVSCNFLNYQQTSPLSVWLKVQELALEYGTEAIGCEVIGLIPKECVLQAGHFIKKDSRSEAELIIAGITELKLNKVKPFNPEEKILEYVLYNAGLCADRAAISAIAPLS